MIAVLKTDFLPLLLVSLAFASVFAGTQLWKMHFDPPAEWTRKTVHAAGGLICTGFPWWFASHWSVLLLCVAFAVVLLVSRLAGLLSAVHGVERKTMGALYFPLTVYLLYYWVSDQAVIYLVSMLVLVVSDALAAVLGKSYGKTIFSVDRERKSLEGSLAFLFSAFLAVQIPLLVLTDMDTGVVLLVALQVALLVTGFEAISQGGMDNLAVPLATSFLLTKLIHADIAWMFYQLSGHLAIIVLAAVLAWRNRMLTFSAAIALQLYLYGAFSLGAPVWTLPALLFAAAALLFAKTSETGGVIESEQLQVRSLYYLCIPSVLVYFTANYLDQCGYTGLPHNDLALMFAAVLIAQSYCMITAYGLRYGLQSGFF